MSEAEQITRTARRNFSDAKIALIERETYLSAELITYEEAILDFDHAYDIVVHQGGRPATT